MLADDLVGVGLLRRRRAGDRLRQIDLARDASSNPGRSPRRSAGTGRRPRSDRRGCSSAAAPRGRAPWRAPRRRPAGSSRPTSRSTATTSCTSRPAHDRCRRTAGDAVERHVELVGGDLAERRDDALADLDLAVAMRTVRSGLKWIQRSSRGLSTRLAGRLGAFMPASLAGRGALDGADDALMGAAAAEMPVERVDDLGARRLGVAVEQRLGGHDDAGQAVAALAGLLVEEGLLQRMQLVRRAEPLDGGHAAAGDRAGLARAGEDRLAVDQHHAGAALLQPAAVARAHQAEMVAQGLQQRRGLRHVDVLARCRSL